MVKGLMMMMMMMMMMIMMICRQILDFNILPTTQSSQELTDQTMTETLTDRQAGGWEGQKD